MTPPGDLAVGAIGVEELPAVELLSSRAFDPRYGESWSKAQCLSVLALPGYRLTGAWRGPDAAAGLVGFAIDRVVAGESELLLLAVDPDARRTGVASALVANWIAHCAERGVTRQFLEMRRGNPAEYLYEGFGFTPVGLRPAYYRGADGNLRDAITMQRQI